MKKVFATILALLYLATSTGASINIHYCMGKLYSVDLNKTEECGKCGIKSGKDGCCKVEYKLIKVKDSHQPVSQELVVVHITVCINNIQYNPADIDISLTLQETTKNNSPPPISGSALCILHCVFRI